MTPTSEPDAVSPVPEKSWRTSLLGCALVALAFFVFAVEARQVAATDYWWQLATGDYVLENGWPEHDAFSLEPESRTWIELRWLYCVLLTALVGAGGASLAVAMKTLVVAVTFGLSLLSTADRRTAPLAIALGVLGLLAISNRAYVRPELVSGAFIALFVFVICKHRDRGGPWIWALPVIQVAWVNSHTLFILGPLIVGAWLASEVVARFTGYGSHAPNKDRLRTSGIVLAATAVACLVNPWFLKGALFPLELFRQLQGTEYSSEITELLGPFVAGTTGPAIACYTALLVLAAAAGALCIARLDVFLTLCTAAFAYLSTTAVRNVPLFVIVALPFVIDCVRRTPWIWSGSLERVRRIAGPAASAIVLVVVVLVSFALMTNRFSRAENSRFGLGINPFSHPIAAVDFLEENGVIGERVFCFLNEGSHLLYRGYSVYFDPRLEVYGEDHLFEYRRLGGSDAEFDRFAEEQDVRVIVLGLGDDQLGFVTRREASGKWRLVYLDHRVFVMLHRDLAPEVPRVDFAANEAEWMARWRRTLPRVVDPEVAGAKRLPVDPYQRLAFTLAAVGAMGPAKRFMLDAIELEPEAAVLHDRLGRIAYAEGDFASAVEHLRAALRYSDGQALEIERAYRLSNGRLLQDRGDTAGAVREFERAVEIRPDETVSRAIEQLRRQLQARGGG